MTLTCFTSCFSGIFQSNKYGSKAVPDPQEGLLASGSTKKRKNVICRNFGSVRCSKCNKFGLSGECCKAYYYVVIRSKKVPREVQKQIAQTAFESFKEAETFRVEIARKYKKMRRKRKRQSQIEESPKLNQDLETPVQKQLSTYFLCLLAE